MRTFNKFFLTLSTVAVLALGVSPASQAQSYKKITRVGTSQSVCAGGVETAAQLQEFFANNPSRIRQIIADAGWTGSADELIQKIAEGDFVERAYPVGTQLQWMGAKVSSEYVALPYREWAGSESLPAFQVNISNGCEIHEIVIPKACCNVSLGRISDSDAPECRPQPVAVVPEPEPAPEPEPVEKKQVNPLALIPFIGAIAGTETRPRFETRWEEERRDSSGILGLRAGLIKPINSKTSVFGQVSYYERQGVNIGNVFPEENFAIDVGVEHRFLPRTFVGAGVGIWDVDDSDFSEASLFAHIGGDIGKTNLQWIVEGRVFDSDSETLDSFSNNRAFSVGIRYLIKK